MAVWLRKTLNIGMTHIPLRGMNDIQKKKLSIIGDVARPEGRTMSKKSKGMNDIQGDYLSQGG